jgi:hypothetical protein
MNSFRFVCGYSNYVGMISTRRIFGLSSKSKPLNLSRNDHNTRTLASKLSLKLIL